jgi:hypothetical protein
LSGERPCVAYNEVNFACQAEVETGAIVECGQICRLACDRQDHRNSEANRCIDAEPKSRAVQSPPETIESAQQIAIKDFGERSTLIAPWTLFLQNCTSLASVNASDQSPITISHLCVGDKRDNIHFGYFCFLKLMQKATLAARRTVAQ